MLFEYAPQRLLSMKLSEFLAQVPLLRDGDERAIHDARVAIRRLREPLALMQLDRDDDVLDALEARLRKVFKALGRARDADIAHRLVQHVESRFPLAPALLGSLRGAAARDQLVSRRRVIKTLESANVQTLADAFDAWRWRESRRFFARSTWREHLDQLVESRGQSLLQAVDHAGGVYFRKRSHGARVAIKEFRYALEASTDLGVIALRDVRSLRKAQNALGEAHDRDVLIQRLNDLADENEFPRQEHELLEQFLTGEIIDQHQKYLAVRPALIELARTCAKHRHRMPLRTAGTIALGAVAAGAALKRVISTR